MCVYTSKLVYILSSLVLNESWNYNGLLDGEKNNSAFCHLPFEIHVLRLLQTNLYSKFNCSLNSSDPPLYVNHSNMMQIDYIGSNNMKLVIYDQACTESLLLSDVYYLYTLRTFLNILLFSIPFQVYFCKPLLLCYRFM